jgi:hypothetical protein
MGASRNVESDRYQWYCVCVVRSDSYEVETDAFGDGCMTYHFALMAKRMLGEEIDADHDAARTLRRS